MIDTAPENNGIIDDFNVSESAGLLLLRFRNMFVRKNSVIKAEFDPD